MLPPLPHIIHNFCWCCEGLSFANHAITHFSCLQRSSRPFDVELASDFFFFLKKRTKQLIWLHLKVFVISVVDLWCLNDGLLDLISLNFVLWSSRQTAAKCHFNTGYQLQTFYLLHLYWSIKEMGHTWWTNLFSVNSMNAIKPLKMWWKFQNSIIFWIGHIFVKPLI